MSPIRVALADDHALLREGMILLLQNHPDIEVVGQAGDGVEALEVARRCKPDVMLLDIGMPRMNGLETLELIRQAVPAVKLVIVSRYEKEAYVHRALKAGALGYVVKGAPSADMLAAVRAAATGNYYLSSQVQASVIGSYVEEYRKGTPRKEHLESLSAREKQVFHLIVQGNSAHEIADILCISSKTVDKHRANLGRKIGTENPVQMVQYALRAGLLTSDLWDEKSLSSDADPEG
ncbi:MAG: response regulator transcription factor [Deltaproteobacteria bacterium]|nr:response regulator transcription factor [Deltaproteobacteria bacterium]NCP02230.1 response regulator transcription factor [Deltaproteobacteria bacterium]NCP78120.1 response regulator transcription factor [Desulfuromonadales bacterium]